ncbi:DUF1840 domain-containing protein [Bordetella holmesii]|uniref:PF08895 domain protein n=2 Tax=Bordetella holmesii TaxID=35814 RepID=A0A158MAT1_9BORD|nr:DUF1840 domain-containing protein [Bordetella holmesii]AHV92690.1 hypothetical protein D560_1512 [Bordetella holmesii ATCC 51541]AIT26177.1 hypothetical protein D558_1503 [Bordetella holmesii 44057]EWM43290.1 hypothetical protein D556_1515 [Bordetella holmesii 41130]EWM46749.1 hypothetical protein D555_1528 [Bordetella holmesii 35009]EWM50916.1 hypothetical protein D557_0765 [Bordetella holmesii 70147]
MLITFHSKATAEVLMRTGDAAPLLQATGKLTGGNIPERGVFTPDQLPAAIAALEAAVAGQPTPEEDENPDQEPKHPVDREVGMQQRAYPLLDMMRQSLAAHADLTWEVSRGW